MKNEAEIAKKNIELSFEFSRYVLANPGLDERIPENALVIFEIADDPELSQYNRLLAQRNREINQSVILVKVKGIAPTRLIEPQVQLTPAS